MEAASAGAASVKSVMTGTTHGATTQTADIVLSHVVKMQQFLIKIYFNIYSYINIFNGQLVIFYFSFGDRGLYFLTNGIQLQIGET